MLRVTDVEACYGDSQVLFGVSFAVAAGEVVTLLGRNGMGKSTTIRTIMGIVPPRSGAIVWDGAPIHGLPPYRVARLGLGLVPEGRQIFPNLTVRENLIATAVDRGAWTLDAVLGLFPQLRERLSRAGSRLSGGEQQMLAIGRALLLDPKILILDEPTQGLAPIVIQQLAETLASLNGRFAMLIVEQNRTFLERLTDRILYMDGGRIVSERTNPAPAVTADRPPIQ